MVIDCRKEAGGYVTHTFRCDVKENLIFFLTEVGSCCLIDRYTDG
jgi:hypothetical protein